MYAIFLFEVRLLLLLHATHHAQFHWSVEILVNQQLMLHAILLYLNMYYPYSAIWLNLDSTTFVVICC